jgi:hypothetical protein
MVVDPEDGQMIFVSTCWIIHRIGEMLFVNLGTLVVTQ